MRQNVLEDGLKIRLGLGFEIIVESYHHSNQAIEFVDRAQPFHESSNPSEYPA